MPGKSILIIPDAHAAPGFDNERFKWLGKYIDDSRPDVITCLGDFADMPSINEAARRSEGVAAIEGRRITADIDVTRDALDKLHSPWCRRRYSPRLEFTDGNHENFIDRVIERDPRLEDIISQDMLPYEEYGWRRHTFKDTLVYAGFAFCHFFPSGDMGRPISGVNVAASLVRKNHMSSVVGHNHRYDYHEEARPDGTKVVGISAGCYTHPDDIGTWNRQTARAWWRGVILLRGARRGMYTGMERTSMEELKERYA